MQTQARLVIVGAGIVGVSAAYHLVKKGWRDIVPPILISSLTGFLEEHAHHRQARA